jgi:MFS family permease
VLVGLAVLAASAWTSPPSLALFLIAGVVTGSGVGAVLRGSLAVVIALSTTDDRASALAAFFTAAYAALSLPVVGLGVVLQHLSPRVMLLLFVVAAATGVLAAAPLLVRRP